MANEKLQFKMGAWSESFDSMAKVPGTVYVTTNEKAMYVDVDADTRIRLGDIIQVDSAKTATPPFSTEALYYFIEENALMKWGAFGTNGAMAWKQLNSVSEITEDLEDLEERVGTLETTVSSHTTAIGGANDGASASGSLYARIAQNASDINGLDGRLETAEVDIDNLQSSVGASSDSASATGTTLWSRVKQNAADIDSLETTTSKTNTDLTNLTNRVTTAEGEIDNLQRDLDVAEAALGQANAAAGTGTAFARIKKLEETDASYGERIEAVETKAANNATNIGTLQTAVADNTTDIAANAAAIDDLEAAIGTTGAGGTTLIGRISTLESEMDTAQSNITTNAKAIKALQDTDTTHTTDISDLKTRMTTAEGEIDALQGLTSGHTDSIKTLQDAVDELEGRVEVNEDAIGSANDSVSTSKTGSLYARTNKNADDIAALRTRMGTAESAITLLNDDSETEGSVDYKIAQAKTNLEGIIESQIKAANAMDYKGAVDFTNTNLPTTGVKIGDTYVVASAYGTYTEGDLLVANGNEVNGVITGTIEWQHVPTGYRKAHNPELSGANNAITLKSLQGAGDVLGSVAFEAVAGTSTTVSVANNKVSIGMEWGSF